MFGGFLNYVFDSVTKKLTIVRKIDSDEGEDVLLWLYNQKPDENLSHKIYALFSKFKNFFTSIGGNAGEILATLIGILFFIGSFYFLYLSFKLGSVGMFILGIFLIPVAGLIGAYSFIFGVPQWILSLFG